MKEKYMQRNGEIDFLRFIFAIFIMILHFGYRPTITIWGVTLKVGARGGFGVLFFFIVSGFFLAKTAKRYDGMEDVPGCCIEFAKKKYPHYMTWYIPAFILCALLDAVKNGIADAAFNVIYSVPNLLLLGSFGFSSDAGESIGYYIGASWFISTLFWCQLILFPIMISNYKRYMYVIAPIAFLFSIASMRSGFLSEAFFPSLAFTAIILGTFAYDIKERIDLIKLKKRFAILLRVSAIIVYIVCFWYMCQDQHENLQYSLMILLTFAIIVSTSEFGNIKLFNKPIYVFLGQVSFPLYLLHIQIKRWGEYIIEKTGVTMSDGFKYMILYCSAVVISVIAYLIYNKARRISINKLITED